MLLRYGAVVVAEPAADRSHNHIIRGDLHWAVSQADTVARRCLPGDRNERVGHTERTFQLDRAGKAENNDTVALADGIAAGAWPESSRFAPA
jgi:hypothetical protein